MPSGRIRGGWSPGRVGASQQGSRGGQTLCRKGAGGDVALQAGARGQKLAHSERTQEIAGK